MKLKYKNKKTAGFTLVELLVVIAIIAALAAISSPIIIRQIARSRATTAISNSKDIYAGVRAFAFERGGETPTPNTDANTSLRTLFATSAITDEKPFFVPGIDPGFVFAYYGEDTTSGVNIVNDEANTPILSAPAITAGTIYAGQFAIDSFGGQAVICRKDGSAVVFAINSSDNLLRDEDGEVLAPLSGGDDFSDITCLLPDTTAELAPPSS